MYGQNNVESSSRALKSVDKAQSKFNKVNAITGDSILNLRKIALRRLVPCP